MTNTDARPPIDAPIMIQGALHSELDLLLSNLEPVQARNIGGFDFFECRFQNRSVVISRT